MLRQLLLFLIKVFGQIPQKDDHKLIKSNQFFDFIKDFSILDQQLPFFSLNQNNCCSF
jgi:hypothetical protein